MSKPSRRGQTISNSTLRVGFLLAALGVPSIILPILIRQNIWLVLCLAIVYELLLFLCAIFIAMWQRFEISFVDRLATRLEFTIRSITQRYFSRYNHYIIDEHRIVDVKGLRTQGTYALELEQVYVQLQVDPSPVHQASENPLSMPQLLLQSGHTIWEYLASPALTNQHFVVIGPPGSGKTMLLKHIALVVAQRKRSAKLHYALPVLLFLREHIEKVSESPEYSLVDAVQEHLQKRGWEVPSHWLNHYLEKGQCLVLLDGLDEVANTQRRIQVVEWVERQMLAYGQNRFILTSRPYGYQNNPLVGVTTLELRRFRLPQIEQFLKNWYLANEIKGWGKEDIGTHIRARQGAEDLLRRLRHAPALLDLAVNPLLLTMIATVHRYRGALPGKRVELYAEICDVFLGKRQEAQGIVQMLSISQTKHILQILAYFLMEQGMRTITRAEVCTVIEPALINVSPSLQPIEFLNMIEQMSGLLLEHEIGVYGFAHLTFQEYLASVYIKEEGLEYELVNKIRETWWHETIRLYCAQADATAIILACLSENPPSVSALTLAFESSDEALKMQVAARDQLNTFLEKGIADPDPERRRIGAEFLLMRRMRQLIPVEEGTFIDTSLITSAEYQLFLEEQREHQNYWQPDHWTTSTFSSSQGRLPVLGVRPSDAKAFCSWLTKRESGLWQYRLPTHTEIEKISTDKAITPVLTAGVGYWIDEGKRFLWEKKSSPPLKNINTIIEDMFDRDLARIDNIDYNNAKALAPIYGGELGLIHELWHKIDSINSEAMVRTNEFYLDNDKAIKLALSSTRRRVLALALINAKSLIKDHALDLDLVCANVGNNKIDLHLKNIDVLDQALAYFQNHALTQQISTTANQMNNQDEQAFLRWWIRYCALHLAIYLDLLMEESHSRSLKQSDPRQTLSRNNEFLPTIKNYLDLYVVFALLDTRVQGKLPAWEGILLTRESIRVEK